MAHLAEGAQARNHPLGARLREHWNLGARVEPERAEAKPKLLGQGVHILEDQDIAGPSHALVEGKSRIETSLV